MIQIVVGRLEYRRAGGLSRDTPSGLTDLIKFSKFIPLEKVEAQLDGSLYVYGVVTAERPDREDEICHYESTKPFYEKMAERQLTITKAVEGMEPSISPMREMHQLSAIGAGKAMNFDDPSTTIRMGFKVVDPVAITKFKSGVYVGFSQGGEYVKTWRAQWTNGQTYTWFTADPGEVSAVDSPCLTDAVVEYMKGREFSIRETDGSTRLVKFSLEKKDSDKPYGDVEYADPGYQSDKKKRYPLDTEKHIRAEWNCIHKPKNAKKYTSDQLSSIKSKIVAAWKKHIDAEGPPSAEKVAEYVGKAIDFLTADALKKGMWTVQDFAGMMDALVWVQRNMLIEAEVEDDGSTVHNDLAAIIADLAECFMDYTEEQVKELLAALSGKGEKAMELETLTKALEGGKTDEAKAALAKAKDHLKALDGHIEKAISHHEKMAEHHEKLKEHHEKGKAMHKAHAEHLKNAMECCKALGEQPVGGKENEGESSKTAPAGDLAKFYTKTEVDELVKAAVTDALAKGPAPRSTMVPRPGEPALAKSNGAVDPLEVE